MDPACAAPEKSQAYSVGSLRSEIAGEFTESGRLEITGKFAEGRGLEIARKLAEGAGPDGRLLQCTTDLLDHGIQFFREAGEADIEEEARGEPGDSVID